MISWPNHVSGSMAGSTSRLPLSNTTFGRPLYWPSHLPRTRLICVPTRDMGPAVFSAVAPPHRCSRSSHHSSGRLCWRGSVSHCRSLKPLASAVCGRHRAASPRSGLRSRAAVTETTLAREAGATVRRNVKLRDMNLIVEAADERSIKVLACGLPLQHGARAGSGHHSLERTHICPNCMPQRSDHQRRRVASCASGQRGEVLGTPRRWQVSLRCRRSGDGREVERRSDRRHRWPRFSTVSCSHPCSPMVRVLGVATWLTCLVSHECQA